MPQVFTNTSPHGDEEFRPDPLLPQVQEGEIRIHPDTCAGDQWTGHIAIQAIFK
jgi:hypothetical protein